jgi:hypothetical protein
MEGVTLSIISRIKSKLYTHQVISYQEGLELNAKHQLLVFANDFNLLSANTNTIKKKTHKALFDTDKETGLEVNAEKMKFMFMSCP